MPSKRGSVITSWLPSAVSVPSETGRIGAKRPASKLGITELTKAVLPWLFTMLVFLAIVTYWPELSLWLPRKMGML